VAEVAVPELPVQPDAETGAAPVAEAAALPLVEDTGDGTATAGNARVSEEVVTADRIRRSDQDFANKVNVTAAEAVAEKVRKKKDKKPGGKPEVETELSDLEKVLLLGLGAVAVGSMLSNNREVELNSGDRVVVKRDDGSYQVIKDDDTLLRQPGSTVRTETFADGSTRTTVTREDGTKIVTIRDAEYRVLRRILVDRNGQQSVLIDDTVDYEPVVVSQLPPPVRQPVIEDPEDELALRLALERAAGVGRTFSLAQVRDIAEVRALVPVIDLDAITFDSGSAAIRPDQARALATLGRIIAGYIEENPREVFLIEGHTDAVGGAAYNLALSDRRAESVALALTEYFAIPPENLVVQGYGEQFLKVDTLADERANRRASVRRITDLLRQAAAN
jgi:outer membrane protein OmpA-like peptidoglycan-associated protein